MKTIEGDVYNVIQWLNHGCQGLACCCNVRIKKYSIRPLNAVDVQRCAGHIHPEQSYYKYEQWLRAM